MVQTKLIGMTCGRFMYPQCKSKHFGWLVSIWCLIKGKVKTCGCAIEAKAKLLSFHCPQKKW